MIKLIFLVLALPIYSTAQNLVPSNDWTLGPVGNNLKFFANSGSGSFLINTIENGSGPFGEQAMIWKSEATTSGKWAGFRTKLPKNQIDFAKSYRFTTWVRASNITSGQFQMVLRGDDTTTPFSVEGVERRSFYPRPLIVLPNDQWLFVVGFVGPDEDNNEFATRGIYDTNGVKVFDIFQNGRYSSVPSGFNFICELRNRGSIEEKMFFYEPRWEEVSSQMPSVQELLNGNNGTGSSVWSVNGTGIYYNEGNVGIGTTIPDAPLTVNGRIHAKEVKVDLEGALAPDYVFYDDYDLRSLEEVREYIDEHGHLPNVPSAEQLEKEGMELKAMNLRLLEKIEELTLYLLEQEKKQRQLEQRIAQLEK